MAQEIEFGTFGVYHDSATDRYWPLTEFDVWEADVHDAMYPQDEEGNVTSYQKPIGMSVIYETTTTCADEVLSMKFNVLCDETMENSDDDTFVPARVTASNLVGCQKFMEFEHYTGCTKYSALGFTNFLN
jgi:hypothetical protein